MDIKKDYYINLRNKYIDYKYRSQSTIDNFLLKFSVISIISISGYMTVYGYSFNYLGLIIYSLILWVAVLVSSLLSLSLSSKMHDQEQYNIQEYLNYYMNNNYVPAEISEKLNNKISLINSLSYVFVAMALISMLSFVFFNINN